MRMYQSTWHVHNMRHALEESTVDVSVGDSSAVVDGVRVGLSPAYVQRK